MYRMLFDDSHLAIVVHGGAGHAVDANQAFADLLGYDLEEARRLTAPDVIHPADLERSDADTSDLLDGRRRHAVLHRRLLHKDGSVIRARVRKVSARLHGEPVVMTLIEEANPIADLEYDAHHDYLTGLWNRRGMRYRLTQRYPDEDLLLAMIDMDDFKHINDHYGHAAGDAVLIDVANRLKAAAGGDADVARWSGDEFVLCVPARRRSGDPISWGALAARLGDAVAVPVDLPGFPERVTPQVSVGVTMLYPGDGAFDLALRRADSRMYRTKRR